MVNIDCKNINIDRDSTWMDSTGNSECRRPMEFFSLVDYRVSQSSCTINSLRFFEFLLQKSIKNWHVIRDHIIRYRHGMSCDRYDAFSCHTF